MLDSAAWSHFVSPESVNPAESTMARMVPGLSHLANPLASPEQLARSASQVDGVPTELEDAVRYHACTTIQAAGILLRLPQQILAESIVLFTRFWVGETGGSLLQFNAQVGVIPPPLR